MRQAMEHLLARYRLMRPLFLAAALPTKDEWKISPYLGVLLFVFSALHTPRGNRAQLLGTHALGAPLPSSFFLSLPFLSLRGNAPYLKRAFSAPRIWTVEAGNLAKLVRLPACEMRRAPTRMPTRAVKFGATLVILVVCAHDRARGWQLCQDGSARRPGRCAGSRGSQQAARHASRIARCAACRSPRGRTLKDWVTSSRPSARPTNPSICERCPGFPWLSRRPL